MSEVKTQVKAIVRQIQKNPTNVGGIETWLGELQHSLIIKVYKRLTHDDTKWNALSEPLRTILDRIYATSVQHVEKERASRRHWNAVVAEEKQRKQTDAMTELRKIGLFGSDIEHIESMPFHETAPTEPFDYSTFSDIWKDCNARLPTVFYDANQSMVFHSRNLHVLENGSWGKFFGVQDVHEVVNGNHKLYVIVSTSSMQHIERLYESVFENIKTIIPSDQWDMSKPDDCTDDEWTYMCPKTCFISMGHLNDYYYRLTWNVVVNPVLQNYVNEKLISMPTNTVDNYSIVIPYYDTLLKNVGSKMTKHSRLVPFGSIPLRRNEKVYLRPFLTRHNDTMGFTNTNVSNPREWLCTHSVQPIGPFRKPMVTFTETTRDMELAFTKVSLPKREYANYVANEHRVDVKNHLAAVLSALSDGSHTVFGHVDVEDFMFVEKSKRGKGCNVQYQLHMLRSDLRIWKSLPSHIDHSSYDMTVLVNDKHVTVSIDIQKYAVPDSQLNYAHQLFCNELGLLWSSSSDSHSRVYTYLPTEQQNIDLFNMNVRCLDPSMMSVPSATVPPPASTVLSSAISTIDNTSPSRAGVKRTRVQTLDDIVEGITGSYTSPIWVHVCKW